MLNKDDISKKTRMSTFIKTKFNKLDDQSNIDNIPTLAANITEYHIISKFHIRDI